MLKIYQLQIGLFPRLLVLASTELCCVWLPCKGTAEQMETAVVSLPVPCVRIPVPNPSSWVFSEGTSATFEVVNWVPRDRSAGAPVNHGRGCGDSDRGLHIAPVKT